MDTFLLMLRVGLSLAAVLGLLWWLSRRAQKTLGSRRSKQAVAVLGRQPLNKRAGVALVEVEGRRLVIGYSDQGVSLVHDAGDAPPEPEVALEASADAIPVNVQEFDSSVSGQQVTPAGDFVPHAGTTVRPRAHVQPQAMTARMADVRRHRTPLDGSILAPDTWRRAVVAVQERTTRRT